ncbi:hypothetical protein HYH02_007276 [Chlamydomonas schloesseri]|uniref:Homologous-pairing protein 2 homolog n=1 Tax=Chlamydomonas schloesseri TaxID=2026947 RepID=A0A835WI02_9CHLO|nr:hypothetical protein HYH02_007276 [Chlamydomonas schloesseri]|eukprot:KAG2447820.1 hypothetical protein HYH02_007276 [Chlamydomonas schloesseri]
MGLKKAQVTKAVDALVAKGSILAKEFGKTKIFLPPQTGRPVLSKEEYEASKQKASELQEQCQKEAAELKQLEAELSQLRSVLSEAEIARQTEELKKKLAADEKKLAMLESNAVLITAEERAAAEKALAKTLEAWRKRRSMFKNIWGAISENMDGKQADLFEEIGVETDEAAGADMAEAERLLPSNKRSRR